MLRIKKIISFGLLWLALHGISQAQDTATLFCYNLLNFPGSTPERVNDFKTIFHNLKPDLVLVNELQTEAGADNILDLAINQNGIDYYQRAAFTDGFGTENMLFYNSRKFVLHQQKQIQTDLRQINEYLVYVNDPELSVHQDTIFLDLFSAHLKAGNQPDDEQKRLNEVTDFHDHLDQKAQGVNIIFGGDFNVYNSNEPGYQLLLSGGNYPLTDPIDMPGTWHANPAFSAIHTQSPRTTAFGGGVTGGIDDRFDQILVTADVMNGTNGVTYVPGSYEAFGNDGQHFNDAITDPPGHPTLPTALIEALHDMSDHLPVIMKLKLDYDPIAAGIADEPKVPVSYTLSNGQIRLQLNNQGSDELTLELINLAGQSLWREVLAHPDPVVDLPDLTGGVYLLKLSATGRYLFSEKILIH